MHGKNVANILTSDGTARENGIIRMALFGQSACETLAGNVNNTRNRQFPMRLYETPRERIAKLRKERNEDNIKRTPNIEWHDDQNRYAIIIKTWAIWRKEKFKMRTRKYEASRRRRTERGKEKKEPRKSKVESEEDEVRRCLGIGELWKREMSGKSDARKTGERGRRKREKRVRKSGNAPGCCTKILLSLLKRLPFANSTDFSFSRSQCASEGGTLRRRRNMQQCTCASERCRVYFSKQT